MTVTASNVPLQRAPDNFAAIRLLAALIVVFGHAFPLTGGHGPGYLGSPASTLAVKVFFVISGYMISESWLRDPNWERYLKRRTLRIFPALVVLCLLTVLVFGPILSSLGTATYFSHPSTWNYLKNIVLYPVYNLPGVFEGNVYPAAVNGSLWTLPIEFSMYILLPIVLVTSFKRVVIAVVALCFSVASIWYTRLAIPSDPVVFYGSSVINGLEMAPYFFWGIFYRLWLRDNWLSLQGAIMAIVILPIMPSNWASAEIVSLILVPYVTLSLGHAVPAKFSVVEKLGDLSYGTYLYGFLIQQVVAYLIGPYGGHWANFIISVPFTLLLAALSWKFIERPAMRLKPLKRIR